MRLRGKSRDISDILQTLYWASCKETIKRMRLHKMICDIKVINSLIITKTINDIFENICI